MPGVAFFTLEDITEWVQREYGPECPASKEKWCLGIYGYLLGVTGTDAYLSDPEGVVKQWIKRRGCSQELRITEDPALLFLRRHHGL